ncbi:MAG: hypothetical protein M1326_09150 [Cyanobacteria bacterium]|nr:hypothetical protein [Cyanobacteriota bacterium]
MQDIDSERNVSIGSLLIPLIPIKIKYKEELLPVDDINMRQRYAKQRNKVADFLLNKGVLKSKKIVIRSRTKDKELKLEINPDKFDRTLIFMNNHYFKHFKSNNETNNKKSAKQFNYYINQDLINDFEKKKDNFNYKKLICLLKELNSCHKSNYQYSSFMLLRAVLDHIPPLLGYNTFEEVANNYSWSKTDKKYMKALLEFRNEADDALHRPISSDQDLLEIENLPNSNRVNRLLQECMKVSGTIKPEALFKVKQKQSFKNIQVRLVEDNITWANYSVSHYVWSSFRLLLEIDNYKSDNPDYISILIQASLISGEKWIGNHFIFTRTGMPDEEFRIERNEIKKIAVFITNHPADSQIRAPMPEISQDPLVVIISTKSGEKFEFQFTKDKIIKG